MEQQLSGGASIQTMKRNGLVALVVAITLLLIVVFLISAGRTPVILILLILVSGVYGLRSLWKARKLERRM